VSSSGARVLLRDSCIVAGTTLVCLLTVGIFCQARYHEASHVYLIIEKGMSFSEIAGRLDEVGLLKDRLLFLLTGRLFGIEHRAKSGRYRFESTSGMVSILGTLYSGATYRERVTIKPGRTIEGVGEVVARAAGIDSTAFVSLASDSSFVASLGIPSGTVEGYLFPETYDIEWQEDPGSVIKRMVSSFFRAFDDSLMAKATRMGMTMKQAVTLASIIEKEALLDEERPRISAVFHNRLERGMRLQADPTVRYALRKWRGRLLYKDLEIASPFNTYSVYGLPPGPICSPSLASLVASLYPTPGSEDLYFVAQGDGSHYFSRNANEHLQAKARYKSYLRSLKAGKDSGTEEDK
jgi:UPF0755 protein